jgi:hypothetical protein
MRILLGNSLECLRQLQEPEHLLVLWEDREVLPQSYMPGFSESMADKYRKLLFRAVLDGKVINRTPAQKILKVDNQLILKIPYEKDKIIDFDEIWVYDESYCRYFHEARCRVWGATLYDSFQSDIRLPTAKLNKAWKNGEVEYTGTPWNYITRRRLLVKEPIVSYDKVAARMYMEEQCYYLMTKQPNITHTFRKKLQHHRPTNRNIENVKFI